MNKDNKTGIKLYNYPSLLLCLIVSTIIFLSFDILLILIQAYIFVIVASLIFAFMIIFFLIVYLGKPFFITQEGISKGEEFLAWNEIVLITCPYLSYRRPKHRDCIVICSDCNMTKDKIYERQKQKWFMVATKKTLCSVLQYYSKPIKSLDRFCDESKPIIMSKQCKLLLEEHNKKFDTVSISET